MQKSIEGIMPYNELFFDNCFYNSFFPIVKAYRRDELPFLLNEKIEYETMDSEGELIISCKFQSIRKFDELVSSMDVEMSIKKHTDTIISDIRSALLLDRVVIVWIDCFYESIRSDMYNKVHWAHTLLVYGFDDEEQLFNIIEHKHKDNLSYEKRTLPYSDMEEAYNGYLHNFSDMADRTFYEFYEKQGHHSTQNIDIDSLEKLSVLYSAPSGDVSGNRGLIHLTHYENFLLNTLASEELISEDYYHTLLEGLNKIINSKKVEKHRVLRMTSEVSIIELIEGTLAQWSHIRTLVAKALYMNKIGNHIIAEILVKFKRISEYESNLNTVITKYCEDVRITYNEK